MTDDFSEAERAGVYKAIFKRRDMRHFLPAPLARDLLEKLLAAAHAAPSVGLMQPWRIIRISSETTREQLFQLVDQERRHTAQALGEREREFMRLKVEGIRDCGELLVMALCDRREEYVFGRRTMPQMDLASVACAIQNLWLAARAEGLGMGWVSLFDPQRVGELLAMPPDAMPVAILCLGEVEAFYVEPMLQQENWSRGAPLDDVLMEDRWEPDKATRAHRREPAPESGAADSIR